MLEQKKLSYFLIEQDKSGARYPLSKAFNGSGFQKAYDDSSIFRFDSEEKVKQACSVQNMMNSLFGSNKTVLYAKEDVQREMFNDKGETIDFKEVTQNDNPQATENVIP
ncbi:hypothetical protein ACWEXK_12125 [Staphylococcus xylosus]|uniref:hypothetical protein n=1 Tax=Staphylococcus xylosus TaxID=1288 RepID=UPI000D1D76F7|nr:hypothetical protein [Staphylococcus xylosus]PTI27888.1 hypothetical protein BU115_03170 [Staphylococcus xylosus]